MTRFVVEGEPVPQPRPRAVLIGGAVRVIAAPGKHPVTAFKQHVRIMAELAHRGPPLQGPLKVVLTFTLPRPQRLFWKTRPMPRQWHDVKPDTDNLAKSVLDACTGVLWHDDCQIAVLNQGKCYAAGDERPAVAVEVSSLEFPQPVR